MTFIVQCMRMKTTFVEKTSHEIPDGTDYFKLQMEEIFKTMFNNAQETRLSFIAEVVVFMALNMVIVVMVVCLFACFLPRSFMLVSMECN